MRLLEDNNRKVRMIEKVLDFWFGQPNSEQYGKARQNGLIMRNLSLMSSLMNELETVKNKVIVYAERYSKIIQRFGRYPNRNQILGRASTPEEKAFLS